MVCLGNICRSPLAQGILESKLVERGLQWTVDSAGTGSWHSGEAPDPRSVHTAAQHGLDITAQRARKVRSNDLEEFDLVLAMDHSNYRDLQAMALHDGERQKIRLILEYAYPGENRSVPDPYWDDDGFEKVYHMLDEACEGLLRQWS